MAIKRTIGVGLLSIGLWVVGAGTHAWSGEAKAGKTTYDKLCASCHGADGKGNPKLAKAMGEKGLNVVSKETQSKRDGVLLKIIVEGSGKMPAAGKNLSKQEQQDVLNYTRSLAK